MQNLSVRVWRVVGVVAALAIALEVAWLFGLRWPAHREAAVTPSAPAATFRLSSAWPPRLHYDASADTLSEITVGDVPLSYGYLRAHPGSDYATVVNRLVRLVDEYGADLVVHFRPAELPDEDSLAMRGAACVADQNQERFRAYHQAVMAAPGPVDAALVTQAAALAGADMARFRDCLDGARSLPGLIADWQPASLARTDLLNSVYVKGQSADAGEISCGYAEPEMMTAQETVTCIERLLARLHEDVQKTVATQPIKIAYLSGGRDQPLANLAKVPRVEVAVIRRANKFPTSVDYNFELYFTPTDVVRVGPLDGRVYTGEGKIIGDELYLTTHAPVGFRTVSLATWESGHIAVAGGAFVDDGELLSYYERLGDRLYYMTYRAKEDMYGETDWRLRELDLKTGKLRTLAKWDKFELYSGPTAIAWDKVAQRLLVTTTGGDGGYAWNTTYTVDPTGAQPMEAKSESIVFACADEATDERCTADEIRIAKSRIVSDERLDYIKSHSCDEAGPDCHCGALTVRKPANFSAFIGCVKIGL